MNELNVMPQEAHRLELVGRERLTVSGVEDVERFDETGIVMSTSAGTLVITGEELHIGKLSLDGGELHVEGRIDSVAYEDQPSGRGGFWGRLSSSPFCWVWPSGPSMICCGPSASGCPGWPRCWTAYMPWPWGRGAFASSWPGRRGNCGDLWCWESWAAPCCFFPPSPPCCGRCGNFGRIPWAVWSAA